MKYVLAVILILIALPLIIGLIQFILGTAFMVVKLLIGLAVLVLIVGLVLRLLNLVPR